MEKKVAIGRKTIVGWKSNQKGIHTTHFLYKVQNLSSYLQTLRQFLFITTCGVTLKDYVHGNAGEVGLRCKTCLKIRSKKQ